MFCLGGAEKCGGPIQPHVSDKVLTASTVLCGNPKPSVTWLYDNKRITTTFVEVVSKDRYQYNVNKTLYPNDCGKNLTYHTGDDNPQKVTSKQHKIDFDCKFNFYISVATL